jgi:hypothetical protein
MPTNVLAVGRVLTELPVRRQRKFIDNSLALDRWDQLKAERVGLVQPGRVGQQMPQSYTIRHCSYRGQDRRKRRIKP